jgi:hypothetical protein
MTSSHSRAIQFVWLALFSARAVMASSATGFVMGLDYSEWLDYPSISTILQIATDGSGSLYILSTSTPPPSSSTVTKL